MLLRLFKILAGRVHIEFNFPKLLRILPDGFELGIGFGMLLFQSGIRNFQLFQDKLRIFADAAKSCPVSLGPGSA